MALSLVFGRGVASRLRFVGTRVQALGSHRPKLRAEDGDPAVVERNVLHVIAQEGALVVEVSAPLVEALAADIRDYQGYPR
jgi:hypothetical protein